MKTGDSGRIQNVGGQALIEGLLMIGPEKIAIAIRKPDHEIDLQIKRQPPKTSLQKVPMLRGAINLFKQMKIGVGALMQSAQYMDIEDEDEDGEEPSRFELYLERKFGDKTKDIVIYVAVVLSLCFTVGLFILLPNFIAGFIPLSKTSQSGLLILNLCEGVIRVSLFMAYLILASRMRDIKRLWQYHGAEHKTINCYENGDPLETAFVKKYSTKHPRCGTSFLFLVMIISILVFSLVDLAVLGFDFNFTRALRMLVSLLIRLVTIPIVAGAAYEAIRLSGKYDNIFTKIVSAPGLLFQRFTTSEPDDGMIEVAIAAFSSAISDDDHMAPGVDHMAPDEDLIAPDENDTTSDDITKPDD